MGQGPHRPLIIGNGRLSRHLQHYFRSAGITFRLWHRQQDQTLASQLPGTTHILLAISDRAIQDFLHENDFGDRTVVHFSGSIVTPKAWGAHPLMTFTDQLYGLAEYRSIPFILDAEAPDLEALLPGLTNPQFRIATRDKARYHALCVLAGNFSVMLWNRLFQGLSEIGIPYQVALPYLRQVTEVIAQSPGQLSGPLVRDDKTTLNSNLASLAGDPYQSVYQSFVQAFGANPATAPALALEVAV